MTTFNLTTGTNYFNGVGNTADTFTGLGGGGDYLDGGGGADTFNIDSNQIGVIVGGSGTDTLNVDNQLNLALWITGVEKLITSGPNLYATAAQLSSFDTITTTGSPTDFYFFLQGAGGTLDLSARYASTAALHVEGTLMNDAVGLVGTANGDNFLTGAFNDTLDGGGGADSLAGGDGNDTYKLDNAGDQITEMAGQGTDTVNASTSYTLASGQSVEHLRTNSTLGNTAINLTGNEIAQSLLGNAAANILDGKGGADTMSGYGGNDTYRVDSSADKVTETAGNGNDTVYASTSYTLGAGQYVEDLRTNAVAGTTAINLTGNEFSNGILGNAGANKLNGGGGQDSIDVRNDAAQDVVVFSSVSHSTGTTRDTIRNFDFSEDKFDFTVVPGAVGFVTGGTLDDGASFNSQLKAAVDSTLAVDGAVLFRVDDGDLAGHAVLVVDADHDGIYTGGSDYVVELINPLGSNAALTTSDFM